MTWVYTLFSNQTLLQESRPSPFTTCSWPNLSLGFWSQKKRYKSFSILYPTRCFVEKKGGFSRHNPHNESLSNIIKKIPPAISKKPPPPYKQHYWWLEFFICLRDSQIYLKMPTKLDSKVYLEMNYYS